MKKISSIFMLALLLIGTIGTVMVQAEPTEVEATKVGTINSNREVGYFEDIIDRIKLKLTLNKENRIELAIKMAEKRLAEIEKFAGEDSEKLKKAQKRYEELISIANKNLERIAENKKDSEEILSTFERVGGEFKFHELKADAVHKRISLSLIENGATAKEIADFENGNERAKALRMVHAEKLPIKAIAALGKAKPVPQNVVVTKISEDSNGDWRFIISLVARIVNSDMDARDKYELITRVRDYAKTLKSGDNEEDVPTFILDLVERIKASSMSDSDKEAFYQRTRNFLASRDSNEDSGNAKIAILSRDGIVKYPGTGYSEGDLCSRDLSFIRVIINRVKNSDMDLDEKDIFYQRIRNFLDSYVEECSGEDESQSNTFFEDLADRISNSSMDEDAKAKLYQRIRDFMKAGHVDEDSNTFKNILGTGRVVKENIKSKTFTFGRN